MIPQIYLRKGKEESLLRRHPWIFSGAIDHIKAEEESDFAEGALVEVYTRQGEFMALGHYQVGSIAVRVLTFEREEIDQAWWNLRIAVAYDVRRTLDLTDNPATTCYRLVHGEGDSLPGLVVDIYGPVAVIQCHSAGMYHARMQIAEALRTVYGARLTAIYDKSSQTLPFKAALGAVDGYLWGTSDHASHIVLENGERFCVNWEKGQKTDVYKRQQPLVVRRLAVFEVDLPRDGLMARRDRSHALRHLDRVEPHAGRVTQSVGSAQAAHDRAVLVENLRIGSGQPQHLDLPGAGNRCV